MSVWILTINGNDHTLQELGINRFEFSAQNMGEDALVLNERVGQIGAMPVLNYGDSVQLAQDSEIRFIGTVVSNPILGMPGQKEQRTYTCRNIIWQLNRVFYEQDWHEDPDNTYFKGRVKLGKDVDDERISIDAAINDILAYAQNAGLAFDFTLPGASVVPPDSEYVDITCFEAIRNLLNWSPSVATSVDYSTGTPHIQFIKRSAAPAKEISAHEVERMTLTPRNDLLLDGVVVNYELTHNVSGETYTTSQQDIAGSTSGLNVLRQTIDLYGIESSATDQQVEVVVDPLPATTGATFFKKYLPGLSKIEELEISGLEDTNTQSLPNVLVSGTVPSWTGKLTATAEFRAKISGKLDGKPIVDTPIAVELTVTNAATTKYSALASSTYTPSEDIPQGLAAQILSDRSTLHYEGSFSKRSIEPDFSIQTTSVCNILPGEDHYWSDAADWSDPSLWLNTTVGFDGLENVRAVVESVRIVRTETTTETTVTIGPPRHLQVQDFIAIARASRERQSSSWSRKDPLGQYGDGLVKMSGHAPNNNSTILAGSGTPLLPIPENAVANMAVMLKHKDDTSLNTTYAVVIGYDDEEPPQPLWYLQIDYWRPALTPTTGV